nr:immunoglobulin heavy chain junction region [Mus musculus]
CASWDGAYW